MTQGGQHELTTLFCLLRLPLRLSLFSPESMYLEDETKLSHKPSLWIKRLNSFLSFILPLYYTAYLPLHFLFLTVVHSCLLPLRSSCSLHHLLSHLFRIHLLITCKFPETNSYQLRFPVLPSPIPASRWS